MVLRSALILVLGFAAAACVETTLPGAIGIERKQAFLVSSQMVESSAAQSYQQQVTTGRQKGAINADRATLDRVRRISDRLIPHVAAFRPDALQWSWEVNVLTADEVNAYCMPGGKIMVYTGLIQKLNTSDAELAAIIGHEIAHALREHGREKVSRAYGSQLALAAFGALTSASDTTLKIANMVSEVTFTLPNSREMETEADHIGLELMARAGYDPSGAVTVFQKMGRASGNTGPAFLSTHPQSEARARDLEAHIPRVLPLYQVAAGR